MQKYNFQKLQIWVFSFSLVATKEKKGRKK